MSAKIKKVDIRGFRGILPETGIALGGRSYFLLAENGHSKSSISDALTFWSAGDLPHFTRENCDLTAAVHVDAEDSSVSVEGQGESFPQINRKLSKDGGVLLSGPDGYEIPEELSAMPVLTHRVVSEFMGSKTGQKKKALLSILGLEDLNEFRAQLKTSCSHAKQNQDAEKSTCDREENSLDVFLSGEDSVKYAEARRIKIGLPETFNTEADVISALLDEDPGAGASANFIELVDHVVSNLSGLPNFPLEGWNDHVRGKDLAERKALATLIRASRDVLSSWDSDTCPTCEQKVDDKLDERLSERAEELAEFDKSDREIRGQVDGYLDAIKELSSSLDALITTDTVSEWAEFEGLEAFRESIKNHVHSVEESLREGKVMEADPTLLGANDRAALHASARASMGDDSPRVALVELTQLQTKLKSLEESRGRLSRSRDARNAIDALLAIADQEIESAILAALDRIGQLTADFYNRLIVGHPYTDIKLSYKPSRGGQVEFSLTFDGRVTDVNPPQRIMSESQLNGLGLALMLARLKVDEDWWRTVVLDDVVNSFDSNHRLGLARLLATEFSDWQIILFTHDTTFARVLQREMPTGIHSSVTSWSPTGGPVFGSTDAGVRLVERLDAGEAAGDLGNVGRRALEQNFDRYLRRLKYSIRYDPDNLFSPKEMLDALKSGLRKRKSEISKLDIFERMDSDSYMANIGSHERNDAAVSRDDLCRLVSDLDELQSVLTCPECSTSAWSMTNGKTFQCKCGSLTA